MRTYKQLNQAQRYQIAILKEVGKGNKEIARLMDSSESTIIRELRRREATARQAQERLVSAPNARSTVFSKLN